MLADHLRGEKSKAVIKRFVISKIKSQFLELPLQVPIHFGQKSKIRPLGPKLPNSQRPKLLFGFVGLLHPFPPHFFKHLRQRQHGHIASESVAVLGNREQLFYQCPAQILRKKIDLNRINPGWKMRIPPVGQISPG